MGGFRLWACGGVAFTVAAARACHLCSSLYLRGGLRLPSQQAAAGFSLCTFGNVPFTRPPRFHGNTAARERAKGARRRPLCHPGSRPKNRPCGLPLPPASRSGRSRYPIPGLAPSGGSRPPARTQRLRRGGFDAGKIPPSSNEVGLKEDSAGLLYSTPAARRF